MATTTQYLSIAFVACSLVVFPQSLAYCASSQALAQQHNVLGMVHYKSKEYEQAIVEFKKAIELDPNHKYANYNLACVYALCVDPCSGSIMIETKEKAYTLDSDLIFEQLRRAVRVDPSVKIKALKDKDFERVTNDVRFYAALGQDIESREFVKKILPKIRIWYDPNDCSPGVFGCSTLRFENDQTFERVRHHSACLSEDADNCKKERAENSGSYSVTRDRVILRFPDGRRVEYGFPTTSGGMESPDQKHRLVSSDPDPCSA